VPIVYNTTTTHILPQFHVIFDDQFTTVLATPSILSDTFYKQLYQSAAWFHKDKYSYVTDLHLFQSHWSYPPLLQAKQQGTPLRLAQSSSTPTVPKMMDPEESLASDPAEHLASDPAEHPAEHLASNPAEHI